MDPLRDDVGPNVRMHVIRRNYVAFYRVEEDEVQIIRVVNAAQDITRVLSSDC